MLGGDRTRRPRKLCNTTERYPRQYGEDGQPQKAKLPHPSPQVITHQTASENHSNSALDIYLQKEHSVKCSLKPPPNKGPRSAAGLGGGDQWVAFSFAFIAQLSVSLLLCSGCTRLPQAPQPSCLPAAFFEFHQISETPS